MGEISSIRVIVLIGILTVTGLLIFFKPVSIDAKKSGSLKDALIEIKGWEDIGFAPLDKSIVETLFLDDYVNMNFSDGKDTIFMYIGYYLSKKKVGAAHDPLVCFPGQGWKISNKSTDKLSLSSLPGEEISYSIMTAQLAQRKELIIYWFQSYDKTNAGTFSQKMTLLWKKILGRGEDNAFVRISIPVNDRSVSEYKGVIHRFINEFYPIFLEYIKKG